MTVAPGDADVLVVAYFGYSIAAHEDGLAWQEFPVAHVHQGDVDECRHRGVRHWVVTPALRERDRC